MSRLLIVIILSLLGSSCHHQYEHGKRIYEAKCGTCHMNDGSGLAALYPPLANAAWLKDHNDKVACIIKYGLSDTIIVNEVTFHQEMPPVKMTDAEMANVINYINNAWGNDYGEISIKEIKQNLEACDKK